MGSEQLFWGLVSLMAVGFFVFIVFGGFPAVNASQQSQESNVATALPGTAVQEIGLSFRDGNYYPGTIHVKQGVMVRLVVDLDSVYGCMRSIVIPEFGVRKTVRQGDNIIEFVPDKAGTFGFSCSMGMGTGTLVVDGGRGAQLEAGRSLSETGATGADSPSRSSSEKSSSCGCGR